MSPLVLSELIGRLAPAYTEACDRVIGPWAPDVKVNEVATMGLVAVSNEARRIAALFRAPALLTLDDYWVSIHGELVQGAAAVAGVACFFARRHGSDCALDVRRFLYSSGAFLPL